MVQLPHSGMHLLSMKTVLKIIMVLAAFTAGTVVYAQSPDGHRFDVHISASGSPVTASNFFVDGPRRWGDIAFLEGPSLARIYGEGHGVTRTTGAFGVGFDWSAARWFSLSLDVDVALLWNERFDSVTGKSKGNHTAAAFYLLPRLKFFYINRGHFRLYSSLGLGAVKYSGFDKLRPDQTFHPCLQISPLGVEYGGRVFGFLEAGAGNMFIGLQGGIGYRF